MSGIDPENEYIGLFNETIEDLFNSATKIVKDNPRLAYFFLKTMKNQKKAVKTRARWEETGYHVPPFLIMSVTGKCNLSCSGCYAKPWKSECVDEEMSIDDIKNIFTQAQELGVSIIMLAGGEPLLRRDVLECAAGFEDIIFPVFTNGLLIDQATARFFKKHKNIFPVISLEGQEVHTDIRRGAGTFKHLESVLAMLKENGVFVGSSITFTTENFDELSSQDLARHLFELGCRLFFFVEYVPVDKNTEHLVPTQEQRDILLLRTEVLKKSTGGLFIAFPGDEEKFGGCLSAGRGFAHINPFGHLEPCPFAPVHNADLKKVELKEGLNSHFLKSIRSNRDMLKETNKGCALWGHQDWLRSLLKA